MLEFFRKYQRFFFGCVTVCIISSFLFFGVLSTYTDTPVREDVKIGMKVDGSPLMLVELQDLSRFIATDREDPIHDRNSFPNLCNDGVIRYDFLQSKLAETVVEEYLTELQGELQERLDKVKSYRHYAHPEASFINAAAVWQRFMPDLNVEIAVLQQEKHANLAVFARLAKLYELQKSLPPETLRRILVRQSQSYPNLSADPNLMRGDLSLFGFHSVSDWFGQNFLNLISQFILNAAVEAKSKGYKVSLEEAKGDLIHHFQQSLQKMPSKMAAELSFHQHLRSLGFDEPTAVAAWQNVLLFRKYFQDIGNASFVDRFSYREFMRYTKQVAVVHKYHWPIQLRSAQDVAEYKAYLQNVASKVVNGVPAEFYSVAEVEKKHPELVETVYRAKIAEVSKQEIALKATLKQVGQWAVDDKNWPRLRKQFSLPDVASVGSRVAILERQQPAIRNQIDQFVRLSIVDEHPEWIQEALAKAELVEKTWSVKGKQDPILRKEDVHYRVEELVKVEDAHIITFAKARSHLEKSVPKTAAPFKPEENPFTNLAKSALTALQKNPEDPKWIQSGTDALRNQFKFALSTEEIKRSAKESWMKTEAFLMLEGLWSPIQVDASGEIVFFYLKERKTVDTPILEQIPFGKQVLSSDAKAWVAERLLKKIKTEKAIVISRKEN